MYKAAWKKILIWNNKKYNSQKKLNIWYLKDAVLCLLHALFVVIFLLKNWKLNWKRNNKDSTLCEYVGDGGCKSEKKDIIN